MKKDIQIWRPEEQKIAPVYIILLPLLTQISVVGKELFGLLRHWEVFYNRVMTLCHYVKHVDICLEYTVGPET